MKRSTLCIMTAVLIMFGFQVSVYAAQIDTNAIVRVWDYENYGGALIGEQTDPHSGSGVVSSSVINPIITNNTDPDYPITINTWASSIATGTSAGYIAASTNWNAPSGGVYDTQGSVNWNKTFIAGATGNYFWDFAIPTGKLEVAGNGSGAGVFAGYELSIALAGVDKWASTAMLTKVMVDNGTDPWYYSYEYATTGSSLGGTVTGDGSYYDAYSITYAPYSGSIGLGAFNAGDSIQIEYAMRVLSGGPAGETYASAYIGDPGSLSGGTGTDGMLGSLGSPQQSVPEPATIMLLGLGLVGLAGIRRKV
jgi:hypothetical protein